MREVGVPDEEAMVHVAVSELRQRMPGPPEPQIESQPDGVGGRARRHVLVDPAR